MQAPKRVIGAGGYQRPEQHAKVMPTEDFSCRYCHQQVPEGRLFDHEANCHLKPKTHGGLPPRQQKPIARDKVTSWRNKSEQF